MFSDRWDLFYQKKKKDKNKSEKRMQSGKLTSKQTPGGWNVICLLQTPTRLLRSQGASELATEVLGEVQDGAGPMVRSHVTK